MRRTTSSWRSSLCIALVAGLSILLAACGGSATTGGSTGSPQQLAEQEGTVNWYGTIDQKDMDAVAKHFMSLYPKITVSELRVTSAQLPARVLTEQKAGTYNADVIEGDGFQFEALAEAGALQKYSSPENTNYPSTAVDPNGFWTNAYLNTTVLQWNPKKIQADGIAAPTSYQDFTTPAWKGKFEIDTGAYNWYVGMKQALGDQGVNLVKAIVANNAKLNSSHTIITNDIEAGTIDGTCTGYGYASEVDKLAGKSVDFINPTPLLVTLNPVGIAKNAPHIHAAEFFENWLLSKDGQQYIEQESHRASLRPDVQNDLAVLDISKPYIVVKLPTQTEYNQDVKEFNAITGLPSK